MTQNEDSPIRCGYDWHAICFVSEQRRTVRLRFAPANPAAMKAFDPAGTGPITNEARSASSGSGLFGLVLREQFPSNSYNPASRRGQSEPVVDQSAPGGSVSLFPGVRKVKELPNDSNPPLIARQPPAAGSAKPRQSQRETVETGDRVQPAFGPPTEVPEETRPSDTEEAAIGEFRSLRSSSGVASMRANFTGPGSADATNRGPEADQETATTIPSAADQKAETTSPIRQEGRAKRAERASTPRSFKPELRKIDAVKADDGLGPLHAQGVTDTSSSAITKPILSPGGSSPGAAAGLAGASGSRLGTPAARTRNPGFEASRGQPSAISADDPSPSNRVHETSGVVPPMSGDRRMRSAESTRPVADPFRVPEQPCAGGTSTAGQYTSLTTAPGPAPIPRSLQISTHSPVPSASSDPGLRSSAAFERMDGAAPLRVLESSPQKLSVGVGDPGLGWIEIRAHSVTGQVAATLAGGSHEAHAAIAAELPAIRDALISQHVAVHSLSAERYSTASGGGSSASNTPNSAQAFRSSFLKPKTDPSSGPNEEEGESLYYISVRV